MKNWENRIFTLDNAKALLIFLVVFGHFCGLYINSKLFSYFYLFIYAFHMPAFLFISGYLSKKSLDSESKHYKYLILFFIIFSLNCIVDVVVLKNYNISIVNNSGLAWYALALFLYTIFTKHIKNYNAKVILFLIILVELLIGYDSNLENPFELFKILTFYPYFYLGYIFNYKKTGKMINNKKSKIFSILAISSLLILVYYLNNKGFFWNYAILETGIAPYAKYAYGKIEYFFAFRCLSYVVALILIFALFSLIPKKKLFISKIGKNSLTIYVLHMPLLNIINYFILSRVHLSDETLLLLGVIVTLFIVIILSGNTLYDLLKNVLKEERK